MTEIQIVPVFPIAIGSTQLGRNFTDKEISFFYNLKFLENTGNLISENKTVLESPELSELKKFFLTSINNYMNALHKPVVPISLRITQSWLNVTKKGQYHHRHLHYNSVFSASFYIKTNEDDRIYFDTPHKQLIKIEPSEYTPLNSHSWWLPATKGSLLMFPSWLEHEVKTKNDDGDRISLSFNTFIVGEIGLVSNNTHLVLEPSK